MTRERKMKIGITYRLFLSILAATSAAVLCIFFIMQWSINRGFIHYLNTIDQGVLERVSERLAEAYSEHGNWDFLRANPRSWIMGMMDEHPDMGIAAGRPRELGKTRRHPPFPRPQRMRHGARMRFLILDAERRPVFGDPAATGEANFRPIVSEGRTIGYVGLLSPKHFLSLAQLQFLKQQKSALILAAFGMVLVVAIFSFPLARRLVRPLKAMASATHDLASGRYSVRVPVSSSDELGQLARDFNAMALTLEKNEKARRQWVADISHELRTPLSVLRGEIEALLEGVRSVTPESVLSLHAEVLRLHRLVDDLYQLSLADLGTLNYRKEEFNLAETLRDSVEPYSAEFARKGIALAEEYAEGHAFTVFADAERMHQLFDNLLENSLKYTDRGGKLVIRLTCLNNAAAVDFEDSAPGVPEGDLHRLFDRLYRGEGSRSRASGGAGLGLAICKKIVEAHDGTISAHPSPLGGVTVRVVLPLAGKCA